jgi:hypothetical protein
MGLSFSVPASASVTWDFSSNPMSVAQGTAYVQAGGGEITRANVYTIDSASMPTSIHSGLLAGSPHRRITVDGTTPQFSFNKNTAGVEWVAIEADGHYLLLDTVKGTTSAVPEPSFYGFFALAMVGLLFGARKLRTRGCCRTKGSLSSSVLSLFREPANRSTAIASDHAVVPSVSSGAMLSRDQRERLAVPSHAVCGCASPSSSIIR